MLKFLFLFGSWFLSINAISQILLWTDDFESTTPSSGTRTPENDGGVGGPPYTSYFCRTPATQTVLQSIAFSGFQGSNYWAGEDHDASGTGFNGAGTPTPVVREQDITWTGININGKLGISFKGLLAANSNSTPFDNRNICNGGATTNTDYVIIRYRIDAGAWTDMLRFFTKGSTIEKYLFKETTGDSCGETPQLTNVFAEYSANIPGTGNTLDLQLVVYTEGNNEEWGADNFRIYYTALLPVSLTYFSGEKESDGNRLYWTTAMEHGNSHFEIQRSTDGLQFQNIGQVKGIGNSSTTNHYSFLDRNPLKQKLYYRLKQIDIDGAYQYSKFLSITNDRDDQVKLFPNPVANNLKIDLSNDLVVNHIQLIEPTGKQLTLQPTRTGASVTYNLSGLPPGFYFIKLISEKGVITKRFRKL